MVIRVCVLYCILTSVTLSSITQAKKKKILTLKKKDTVQDYQLYYLFIHWRLESVML